MLKLERLNGQTVLLEMLESFAVDGYASLEDILQNDGRQFAAVIQDLLKAHHEEMDAE